jgi:hypothetical protein
MELLALEKTREGGFRSMKSDEKSGLAPEDLLDKIDNLVLASRSCDGAYYPVHSDIKDIIKKRIKEIEKGQVDPAVKEIFSDESCHGQRFVIFQDGEKAFLLGELGAVLRLLGEG